jgi:hypothetical protein
MMHCIHYQSSYLTMNLFELMRYCCALIKNSNQTCSISRFSEENSRKFVTIYVDNFHKVSVPLPLLSQSHFRHALLRAGVGHSTPAYKGLLVTVSIIMSIVTNDLTCSLSITQYFFSLQPEYFCVLKFYRQADGLKNRSGHHF